MRQIAIAFILLLAATRTVVAASTLYIDVAVVAPASISDELLNNIFVEAAAIWAPADVMFRWHRSTSIETSQPDYLLVTFEPSTTQTPATQAALGWITFEGGRPAHTIHLAPGNAEALIHRTPAARDGTVSEHDVLLGRALGRAFAHETGHYLLQSKAHSAGGLMRPAWPAEEFLAPDRSRFALSPEVQEAVRWASPTWAPGEEQ